MKTKKFIAPTLKEATEKMKSELGNNAIILGTRIINKQNDGTTKKFFELAAGIEDDYEEIAEMVREKPSVSQNQKRFKTAMNFPFTKTNTSSQSFPHKINSVSQKSTLKQEIETVIDTLKARDVSKEIISLVLEYLKKSKSFLTINNLDDYVITSLASMIKTRDFYIEKRKTGRVISIVGPTGVGKTTCVAKLAAISKIIHNLDIGIISIDTYRLGAIDQLRIFSEISNVDMLVAYEPEDMPKLISKMKKKDLIFIDTTGRSQRNVEELEKMKEFFNKIKVDETYLTLSLTSSVKNLYDAAEKFKIFSYDSFIFTKIDEAVTHGSLLNLSVKHQIPVIYLTNGQIIPDDILSADSENIANLIYNGSFN